MRHTDIVMRQRALQQRSHALRQQWIDDIAPLRLPLALADLATGSLTWLYRNPAWPLAAGLAWLALRPRRWLWVARRGWWIYRLGSGWRRWSASLSGNGR